MIVKENSYRVVYNIIIMLSFVFRFRNSTHYAVSWANIAWDNLYLSRCIHFSQSIGKIFKNIFIYLMQSTFATSCYRKKIKIFVLVFSCFKLLQVPTIAESMYQF